MDAKNQDDVNLTTKNLVHSNKQISNKSERPTPIPPSDFFKPAPPMTQRTGARLEDLFLEKSVLTGFSPPEINGSTGRDGFSDLCGATGRLPPDDASH